MTLLSTVHNNKKAPMVLFARFCFLILLLNLASPAVSAEGKVVLIAATGSNIESLSVRDVRRLYLGLKSTESKSVGNPVINIQSEEVYDEFLKNIMRMTAGSYKRKLVKAIFRQGREEIPEITSLQELNDYLLKNKGDVSFVELTALDNMESIEVVQILW